MQKPSCKEELYASELTPFCCTNLNNMISSQEWSGQRSDRSSPEEEEVTNWTDPETVSTKLSTKMSTKLSIKVTSWTAPEVSTKTDQIEEEIVDC